MDIITAKDNVIRIGRELVKNGLIARTWGNVSQRLDNDYMLITPSGRDYDSLTRDDIVKVSLHDLSYDGDIKPSSEKGIHALIYRQCDNANFVIHTHQTNASAISACDLGEIKTRKEYKLLNSKVVCASYGLPSTKKLQNGVEAALKATKGNCIIMKNHGAVCFGGDSEEALISAIQLEDACQQYIKDVYTFSSGETEYSDEELCKYVMHTLNVQHTGRYAYELAENPKFLHSTNTYTTALSDCKKPLKPLLDDFAQLVGVRMQNIKNSQDLIETAFRKVDGVFIEGTCALLNTADDDEAKALSMVIEKNCKAFIVSNLISKPRYINMFESLLMRFIYKKKYSKQKDN